MTPQTKAVLSAMLDAPTEQHYGLELARRAGLKTGTLYPILTRLERNDLVTSFWEDIDPGEVGRPARKYYLLTGSGIATAHAVLGDASTSPPLRPEAPPA